MTAKPIPSPPKVQAPPQAGKPREEPKRFTVTTGTLNPHNASASTENPAPGQDQPDFLSLVGQPLFIDLQGGTRNLDVARIEGVSNWDDLRFLLRDKDLPQSPMTSLPLTRGTEAQDLAEQWTIKHVPNSSGKYVQRPQAFGLRRGVQPDVTTRSVFYYRIWTASLKPANTWS